MRVIGTAGHVDHGKSSLVQALTGIHPDRLAEEQARQLTIDLGFAWLTLPNDELVGIVDVPGHEDFIENMLAGVGGIDAAILVIAADEGVMPQTREHLAILSLLEIPQLVVAISKVDAVDDLDWLDLVQLDVQEVLETTQYADAPLVMVSAHTGDGLGDLVEIMTEQLNHLPPKASDGMPMLPIDRVFTLSGFGTVVTGTLLGGALQVGDSIEIQPSGRTARIRGIQHHNESVEIAHPGTRTAINLSGVDRKDVQRGDMLTLPATLRPTLLADVLLQHLPDALRPLKHNAEVKIFIGTAERVARVRLLAGEQLAPGNSTFAQLMFREMLPAVYQQRFIMRVPSPAATIGGGIILDTAPGRKWKRNQSEVMARFERLLRGTSIDLLSEALIRARQPLLITDVAQQLNVPTDAVQQLADEHNIVQHSGWLIHANVFDMLRERVMHQLEAWHTEQPLLVGMRRAMLKDRLRLDGISFDVLIALLMEAGDIVQTGDFFHMATFEVRYSKSQQLALDTLASQFSQNPYTPPSVKESVAVVGETVFESLLTQGTLVRIGADVVLTEEVYREWLRHAYEVLQRGEPLTVKTLRDAFATSRKYAVPFLDHLDSLGLTRRVGDERVLGRGDWGQWL